MSEQSRRRMSAEDLWRVSRVGRPVAAPGGGFVVVGVTTFDVDKNEGKQRLWVVPAGDGRPREGRPLTAPDVSSGEPAISPDQRNLAFVRASGKDEPPQLYVMPLDGGEGRRVTDLPLGVTDPHWFPDGKRLAVLSAIYREAPSVEGTRKLHEERKKQGTRPYVSEDRVYRFWDRWLTDGEVHHIFVVDTESGAVTDLTPDSDRWFDLMDPDGQLDISPEGDEIVFSANTSPPPHRTLRAAIFAVSTAGGPVRCLTPDNPSDDIRPRYTPDGLSVIFGAKKDIQNYADRVRIARLDRRSGAQETLTEAWDRSAADWELADGHTLIIEAEERGRSCLFRLRLDRPGATPELITRDTSLFGPQPAADGWIYAQSSAIHRPPEVVRVRVDAADAPAERLSHFNDELLAGIDLGRSEELEFEGANGDRVHMFLLFPPGHDASRPAPLLQVIHGGPYGQHQDMWHFRWNQQVFVAPGYVGAFVNFHGSSGFGQGFSDSVLGDWGGKAAEDLQRATDVLVARKIADPQKIAIVGGSFGGYMTCWLATRSDRWACAIAHAAVFDTASLTAGDVVQGLERELGAEPWSLPATREALDRWNPKAWSGKYQTPTLVVHGEKDYRVSLHQALDLYGTLKTKGVDARLVYYADENHWILKPKNSLHWYGEFMGWLKRYLG